MIDYASQAARTLLAIADRREEIDASSCRAVFSRLAQEARVRRLLEQALGRHHLSSLQFAILVVLFEAAPEPIPMAILAQQAEVSRPAVTDALRQLEKLNLTTRTRDSRDRRIIHARITEPGREKIERAVNDFLHAASDAAHCVEKPAGPSEMIHDELRMLDLVRKTRRQRV